MCMCSGIPPRNGTEASGGNSTPQKDPFLTQKAKTIKTLEAGSRAVGDLSELHDSPQRDSMLVALRKMIETVKAWK